MVQGRVLSVLMGLTEARLDSIRSRWIFRWPLASTTSQFAFNGDLITSQLVINTVSRRVEGVSLVHFADLPTFFFVSSKARCIRFKLMFNTKLVAKQTSLGSVASSSNLERSRIRSMTARQSENRLVNVEARSRHFTWSRCVTVCSRYGHQRPVLAFCLQYGRT